MHEYKDLGNLKSSCSTAVRGCKGHKGQAELPITCTLENRMYSANKSIVVGPFIKFLFVIFSNSTSSKLSHLRNMSEAVPWTLCAASVTASRPMLFSESATAGSLMAKLADVLHIAFDCLQLNCFTIHSGISNLFNLFTKRKTVCMDPYAAIVDGNILSQASFKMVTASPNGQGNHTLN
ncbi:hypothetical protein EMCRGX_G016670 [Ephydatia muelleri]